jgi:AraC-like DNA-binding protein
MVARSRERDWRIQKVVDVLDKDPLRTLPELAHDCHISVSRLSHLFKEEIGKNVKHYRHDCRIQLAAVLLLSTEMPIKAIAYSAGYRHCSSFVRAFNSRFGMSPSQYRTKCLRAA